MFALFSKKSDVFSKITPSSPEDSPAFMSEQYSLSKDSGCSSNDSENLKPDFTFKETCFSLFLTRRGSI